MNPFVEFIIAAWKLTLEISIQASVLIVLVLMIQLTLGKWLTPGFKLLMWTLVGIRLVLPFTPPSDFSVFNLLTPAVENSVEAAEPTYVPTPVSNWDVAESPAAENALPAFSLFDWIPFGIGALWLLGFAGMIGWALLRQIRMSRWVGELPIVRDPAFDGLLRQAGAETGVNARLTPVEAPPGISVAIFGFMRPTHLLIPRGFAEDYSRAEALGILRHELEHVRRRDLMWNWVALGIQALHWFNPLVWIAGRRFRSDRELYCDQSALQGVNEETRHEYGSALLRAVELSSTRLALPSFVPFTSRRSEIKHRMTMILKPQSLNPLAQSLAICLALVGGLATFTSARADDEEGKESAEGRTIIVRVNNDGATSVNGNRSLGSPAGGWPQTRGGGG